MPKPLLPPITGQDTEEFDWWKKLLTEQEGKKQPQPQEEPPPQPPPQQPPQPIPVEGTTAKFPGTAIRALGPGEKAPGPPVEPGIAQRIVAGTQFPFQRLPGAPSVGKTPEQIKSAKEQVAVRELSKEVRLRFPNATDSDIATLVESYKLGGGNFAAVGELDLTPENKAALAGIFTKYAPTLLPPAAPGVSGLWEPVVPKPPAAKKPGPLPVAPPRSTERIGQIEDTMPLALEGKRGTAIFNTLSGLLHGAVTATPEFLPDGTETTRLTYDTGSVSSEKLAEVSTDIQDFFWQMPSYGKNALLGGLPQTVPPEKEAEFRMAQRLWVNLPDDHELKQDVASFYKAEPELNPVEQAVVRKVSDAFPEFELDTTRGVKAFQVGRAVHIARAWEEARRANPTLSVADFVKGYDISEDVDYARRMVGVRDKDSETKAMTFMVDLTGNGSPMALAAIRNSPEFQSSVADFRKSGYATWEEYEASLTEAERNAKRLTLADQTGASNVSYFRSVIANAWIAQGIEPGIALSYADNLADSDIHELYKQRLFSGRKDTNTFIAEQTGGRLDVMRKAQKQQAQAEAGLARTETARAQEAQAAAGRQSIKTDIIGRLKINAADADAIVGEEFDSEIFPSFQASGYTDLAKWWTEVGTKTFGPTLEAKAADRSRIRQAAEKERAQTTGKTNARSTMIKVAGEMFVDKEMAIDLAGSADDLWELWQEGEHAQDMSFEEWVRSLGTAFLHDLVRPAWSGPTGAKPAQPVEVPTPETVYQREQA